MAFVNIPPNLQDMFYQLTDRIAKLETGPNQAMYYAESAQSSSTQAAQEATQALIEAGVANALGVQALAQANVAIAQGTQAIIAAQAAQVQATQAYNLGAQSIQKSANTITNVNNQLTAINGNGITVYAGASSTSGARVVLNSAGLAGFNSSGTATFAINASTGAVSTNGAIFTSSTITGGSLNINGQCTIDSAGVLYANGATIIGNITATSGTFTGTVYASAGTFTGTITSSNATITGGSLTVGANFSVNTSGSMVSSAGSIGGWTITSAALSKTVGTKTMTLDSGNAILTISDSSSGILSGGGINITSAGTTGSYGAGAISFGGLVSVLLTGGNLQLQGGATSAIRLTPGAGLGSTTYNVQVEGHLNNPAYTLSTGTYSASSTDQSTGTYLSASGAMIARRDNQIPIFSHRYNATGTAEVIRLVYNGTDAGGITTTAAGSPAFRTASDYRLKSNITDFVGAIDIIKALRLRSFTYNIEPDKTTAGFIAHELEEVLPELVMGEKDAVDDDGNPIYQAITATNLIPYLTGALKDVIVRLEALEG